MSLHCDCLHTSEVTGETVVRETDVRQEYKLWVEFVYSCCYFCVVVFLKHKISSDVYLTCSVT